MTTSTLFSSIGYNQNAAGPPVPALTVVDAGGLVTQATFTMTVTPITGWARASIMWGPDNLNFPGQASIEEQPTGTGTATLPMNLHGAALEPASGGNDGPRYFKGELMQISPGATATLTVTY